MYLNKFAAKQNSGARLVFRSVADFQVKWSKEPRWWIVRGCILILINAERNIVDQRIKLPILYDALEIMTWYFHKKREKKERKRKQTRRKWFAKCYLKAENLLNDESQRILTTNLLVKNHHLFWNKFNVLDCSSLLFFPTCYAHLWMVRVIESKIDLVTAFDAILTSRQTRVCMRI